MTFTAKNIRGKGRKISFTIDNGEGLVFSHTLVASFRLFTYLGSLGRREKEAKDAQDQFDLGTDTLKALIGEDNFDAVLIWLEENAESLEEEGAAIGELTQVLVEKILPKLQSSAEKA